FIISRRDRLAPIPFRMSVLQQWRGASNTIWPFRMAWGGIIEAARIVKNRHLDCNVVVLHRAKSQSRDQLNQRDRAAGPLHKRTFPGGSPPWLRNCAGLERTAERAGTSQALCRSSCYSRRLPPASVKH